MAAAGATCGDGRGEEEVHNSDATSARDVAPPAGTATTASAETATTANNSDDSERWPRQAPAAGTGTLPAGQFCMPAAKEAIEIIKDLKVG